MESMKSVQALAALVIALSGCVTAQQAVAADQEFICDLTRWDYDQNGDRIGGETLKYSLVINLSNGLAHGPIDGQISVKGTDAKSTFWKAAYGADRTTYCDVGDSESTHRGFCQCRPVDAGGVPDVRQRPVRPPYRAVLRRNVECALCGKCPPRQRFHPKNG